MTTRPTAYITGAASGMGAALSRALAAQNYALALADVGADRLSEIVEEAKRAGASDVRGYLVDVRDREKVAESVQDFCNHHGALGKVFANAGIGFAGVPFSQMSDADWNWLMSVNLMGVVNVVGAALPGMIEAGTPGEVAITSSVGALFAMPGWNIAAYAASKAAVAQLAQGFRDDAGDAPIQVSVVYPGLIATDIHSNFSRLRASVNPGSSAKQPAGLDLSAGMSPDDAAAIILGGLSQRINSIFTHPDHSLEVVNRVQQMLSNDISASRDLIQSLMASHEPN